MAYDYITREGSSLDPVGSSDAIGSLDSGFLLRALNSLESPSASLEGVVSAKADAAAVILAGGSGERFGREGGKQMFEILGKPILSWSIETFDAVAEVGLIVVVCPDERRDEFRECAIESQGFVTPIVFASDATIDFLTGKIKGSSSISSTISCRTSIAS